MLAPRRRWRAESSLIWTQFDDFDDWVVFNPRSADIHLISSAARSLWELACDGQLRSVDELATALAARTQHPPNDELRRITGETLDFMDRVGLLGPML